LARSFPFTKRSHQRAYEHALRCTNRETEEADLGESAAADFKKVHNNNSYTYDEDYSRYDEDADDEYVLREDEREKAYLVGVEFLSPDCEKYYSNTSEGSARAVRDLIASGESLLELERLANAAGLTVVGSTSQKLDRPRPATLIGKGKAFEVRAEARRLGATTVFFDCELSPSQAKNLDKILNKKVAAAAPPPASTSTASNRDWAPIDNNLTEMTEELDDPDRVGREWDKDKDNRALTDFTIDFEAATDFGAGSANRGESAESLFPKALLDDF
jgi:hypothetical protein